MTINHTKITFTSKYSDIISLIIILMTFFLVTYDRYWLMPIRPDELLYVLNVEHPEKNLKLFFRFYNFYTAKLFTIFFNTSAQAAAFTSFLYASGLIVVTFLSIGKVGGKSSQVIGSILIATYPTLFYQSTWFGSDMACLFYGILSIYFSISVFLNNRYRHINVMLSGFFIVASIYSKQTGISFLIPVLFLLWPKRDYKSLYYYCLGTILSLLLLSFGNYIWLNDFFYHINPLNYVDFLKRFSGQISEDVVTHAKWTPTLFEQIKDSTPWVLIYIISTVILLFSSSNYDKKTKYVAFCVFMGGFSSALIHEIFHTWYIGLNIHFRYMLTMLIPIMIAFSMLIPSIRHEKYVIGKITFNLNIIFSIIFSGCLIFLENQTYYKDLKSQFILSNSILHVFSFWIFLLGVCFILYRPTNGTSKNFLGSSLLSIVGFILIIVYSSFWANIHGEYQTWRMVEGRTAKFSRLEKQHRKYDGKLLMMNLTNSRIVKNYIEYAYVNNVIGRVEYLDTIEREFTGVKKDFNEIDLLSNVEYQFVWTSFDISEMQFLTQGQNLVFEKKLRMFGNNIYEIQRGSSSVLKK